MIARHSKVFSINKPFSLEHVLFTDPQNPFQVIKALLLLAFYCTLWCAKMHSIHTNGFELYDKFLATYCQF